MFGFKTNVALNHIFLEFKKEVFYNFDKNVGVDTFCERVISKIRKNMIKEKKCVNQNKCTTIMLKNGTNLPQFMIFVDPT